MICPGMGVSRPWVSSCRLRSPVRSRSSSEPWFSTCCRDDAFPTDLPPAVDVDVDVDSDAETKKGSRGHGSEDFVEHRLPAFLKGIGPLGGQVVGGQEQVHLWFR